MRPTVKHIVLLLIGAAASLTAFSQATIPAPDKRVDSLYCFGITKTLELLTTAIKVDELQQEADCTQQEIETYQQQLAAKDSTIAAQRAQLWDTEWQRQLKATQVDSRDKQLSLTKKELRRRTWGLGTTIALSVAANIAQGILFFKK